MSDGREVCRVHVSSSYSESVRRLCSASGSERKVCSGNTESNLRTSLPMNNVVKPGSFTISIYQNEP